MISLTLLAFASKDGLLFVDLFLVVHRGMLLCKKKGAVRFVHLSVSAVLGIFFSDQGILSSISNQFVSKLQSEQFFGRILCTTCLLCLHFIWGILGMFKYFSFHS